MLSSPPRLRRADLLRIEEAATSKRKTGGDHEFEMGFVGWRGSLKRAVFHARDAERGWRGGGADPQAVCNSPPLHRTRRADACPRDRGEVRNERHRSLQAGGSGR